MSALYVETVHGDPTIWIRTPDNPHGDEPALIRTGANARAFDALAALVEAAQEDAEAKQCTACDTGCANPACFMPAALTVADVGYCVPCARDQLGGRL